MTLLLSVSIAIMFAGGIDLLLRRDLIRNVLGIGLLGNAVNLALFTLGRGQGSSPPLIDPSVTTLASSATDPVPQALVLTAIVIGFGMIAYTSVLLYMGREAFRTQEETRDPEEGV